MDARILQATTIYLSTYPWVGGWNWEGAEGYFEMLGAGAEDDEACASVVRTLYKRCANVTVQCFSK